MKAILTLMLLLSPLQSFAFDHSQAEFEYWHMKWTGEVIKDRLPLEPSQVPADILDQDSCAKSVYSSFAEMANSGDPRLELEISRLAKEVAAKSSFFSNRQTARLSIHVWYLKPMPLTFGSDRVFITPIVRNEQGNEFKLILDELLGSVEVKTSEMKECRLESDHLLRAIGMAFERLNQVPFPISNQN